jgi:MarR family 2-MHQ and catechol resistance regulon transcriptional repressor
MTAPKLWMVLSKCHHAFSQLAERSIAGTGLCLSDFMVLEALLHKGPLTITAIQEKVLLASGSMTAAVDRVEKKGLVARKPAPADRRARLLELTAEGRRTAKALFEKHARDLEVPASALSGAERRRLYELLKKLGLAAAGISSK